MAAEHSALARSRQAVLPGLAAGVVVLAVGAWADRGLQGLIVADLRAEQLRTLGGYAAALERQLAKHALLTTALTGWQRSRGNASSPEELEAFARPLLNANPSVRSFNTVEGTVITGVFPLQNNQPALGLDLARHPNPGPVAALNRAIANDSIALMGPIELAQTGSGLLLFQSTHTERNGKPVVAEVVVDVPVLLEEVAISDLQAWSRVSLTSESGAVLFGEASLTDPVQVSVVVPESTWTLSAMPVGGWLAGTDSVLWAYRGGLVAVAVLVGLLVFRVQREGDHLRLAVDTATAKLHEANAELQAAQRFQDAAMAAGSVRLWAYDVDTGVMKRVGVNPHLKTIPANETLDSYLHRVHPEDKATIHEAVQKGLRDGYFSCEFRDNYDHGKWRWVRAEGRATERRDGKITYFIGAAADTTHVKRLEAELLHSGRIELMGQLAGGVVHDINNALTVVLTSLELALLCPETPVEDYRQAAEEATEAAKYAAVLTSQMLTFARKDDVRPVELAWDALCREVTGFLARVIGSGTKLRVDLQATDARVLLDRTHAMQILANLATNARDAMGGRGTVTITTRRVQSGQAISPEAHDGPAVVTEVTDHGPGVPESVRDTLFEAFVTTKGKGKGTGLGLSTSRRIARDAGGDLTFTTSSNGSTFIVVLPEVADA